MQPRERAPCPADRIERAARQDLQQLDVRQRFADDLRRLLGRALRKVHQREAAERQGRSRKRVVVLDFGQFERSAAQIPDQSVRIVNGADDAQSRESGFPLAAEQFDLASDGAFGQRKELRPVRRVPNGGCRDAAHVADPHRVAENPKSLQRGQRLGHPVFGQEAARGHSPPQTAQRLFVEGRRRRARVRFVGDQTN